MNCHVFGNRLEPAIGASGAPLDILSLPVVFISLTYTHVLILYSWWIFYKWVVCDWFQWYFYVRRRHRAQEWKIQPNKWMSPELERHEILFGASSLFVTGSFSAFLACYIYNGNPSAVYYQFDEFGWLWFILQFPAIFIYVVRWLCFYIFDWGSLFVMTKGVQIRSCKSYEVCFKIYYDNLVSAIYQVISCQTRPFFVSHIVLFL